MLDRDPLLASYTRTVMLELTTRCNLRCTYCAVSHPDYVSRDLCLDPREVARRVAQLRPHEIQINGHGETTLFKGWVELACELLDRGYPLTITTNLAKRLSEAEVEVLSRFAAITVSCDSPDPETFAALRRGGNLERVEENLARITRACDQHPRPRPYLAINCVLSDRNVAHLEALVDWVAQRGAACLSLTHLVMHAALAPAAPGHPTQVAGAQAAVDKARRRARSRRIDFNVMGGLATALREQAS